MVVYNRESVKTGVCSLNMNVNFLFFLFRKTEMIFVLYVCIYILCATFSVFIKAQFSSTRTMLIRNGRNKTKPNDVQKKGARKRKEKSLYIQFNKTKRKWNGRKNRKKTELFFIKKKKRIKLNQKMRRKKQTKKNETNEIVKIWSNAQYERKFMAQTIQ